MSNNPKLVIISAPSGSGKTTIVKHLIASIPSLGFSVSATSREKREGEVHGHDYFFITPDDFKQMIESGELLEWQEVYSGNFYGTLHGEVNKLLDAGKSVIFDVDVVGGLNIKKVFGDRALAIFVSPPSIKALEQRLKSRNTDSIETINKRVEKAEHEMKYADKFDYVLLNDCLETAKETAVRVVKEFMDK